MNQLSFLSTFVENLRNKSFFHEKSDGFEDKLSIVIETEIQPLTDVQRKIFLTLTIFIFTVAFIGNVLVLYVNFSR